MSKMRRQVGFIASLGSTQLNQLLWPEGAVALVIGAGGGFCLVRCGTLPHRTEVVGEGLALVGLLLGIVFTTYSLLIAFFSDDYIKLLDNADDGIVSFLRPYISAIGLQIVAILLSIGYRASASQMPTSVEHSIFIVWSFLFVYTLVDTLALARNVAMHAITRAKMARVSEDTSASIHHIDGKTKEQGN
jgi:hypothetical protein